eukprot:2095576-Rhodomonas_salina.1
MSMSASALFLSLALSLRVVGRHRHARLERVGLVAERHVEQPLNVVRLQVAAHSRSQYRTALYNLASSRTPAYSLHISVPASSMHIQPLSQHRTTPQEHSCIAPEISIAWGPYAVLWRANCLVCDVPIYIVGPHCP